MINKKNILILVCLLSIVCIGFIILIIPGYSKYFMKKNANFSAKVGNVICKMDVSSSVANSEIINPYCIIEVKNYNENNEITDLDVNYKIEVKAIEDFTLPRYYWTDLNGTIISYEETLTGSFTHTEKQVETYMINFINSGIEDITRLVEFNIVAIQAE